ncbi:hypothetical protein [Veronia pacifica]|uniref:hypothetical protein n=1 Tax=Veronia pacifica TaxID=1080227 RepID=UPI001586265E|nr:hypothetical protein [Veronia pacifica]
MTALWSVDEGWQARQPEMDTAYLEQVMLAGIKCWRRPARVASDWRQRVKSGSRDVLVILND